MTPGEAAVLTPSGKPDSHLNPQSRFRPEWNVPSNRYGVLGVSRNLVPFLLACGAVPYLASFNPYLPWLLGPVIGLLQYRLTIVMHDCVHATLFRSRRANRIVGELMGALTGIDYRAFRKRHLEHHRIYGKADDPQGFHYLRLDKMSGPTFVWHVVKPLTGANLRYVFAESILHPANAWGMFRSGRFFFVVSVQMALLAVVTGFGSYPVAALIPAVSASTFGLFFSQLRGIAEHGVGREHEQVGFVRSHLPTFVDALFLYDLNFNFHELHHHHPNVPSCHLPALHRATGRMAAADGMWHTIRTLAG